MSVQSFGQIDDWVFVYELSGSGFDSSYNHIIKKDFLKAISDNINPKINCFYRTTIQLKIAIKLIQSLMHFVAKYL